MGNRTRIDDGSAVTAADIARFLNSAPVAFSIGAVILLAFVGGIIGYFRGDVRRPRIAAWIIVIGFAIYVFGDLLAMNWPFVAIDGIAFLIAVALLLFVILWRPARGGARNLT
jgi:uncharacterized membrane protein (UPF0136 family)